MNKLRVFHGGSVISSQLVDSIAICGGSLGELGVSFVPLAVIYWARIVIDCI